MLRTTLVWLGLGERIAIVRFPEADSHRYRDLKVFLRLMETIRTVSTSAMRTASAAFK